MNTTSSAGRTISPLVWIVVVGLILRFALLLAFEGRGIHISDESDYHRLASNLVRFGEYGFTPGKPDTIRPPLYPAFVAGIYALAGVGSFQTVRLVQLGLSIVTACILYDLGVIIYGRRTGVWLGALFCVYPSLLIFNDLVLTEVLFTLFLVATCYALTRALRASSLPIALAAGVLLGLSALTRSVMWLFPAPLAVLMLLTWRGNLWQRIAAAFAVLLGFSAVIGPWAARCSTLEKTFIPVDCIGGRNMMMGNYEYTPLNRAWDAISEQGDRAWDNVLAKADSRFDAATQGQRDKLAVRYALKFIAAHPGLTLERDAIKFFDFWGLERELVAAASRGYFGRLPAPALAFFALLIVGSYATAIVSGLFGAFVLPPPDRRAHLLLLLVIGFICGIHTLTFGHSRYHLPVMPLVLIYSARAIEDVRGVWQRRGQVPFRLAACCSGLLFMSWLCMALFVDLHSYLEATKVR